jgi:hypothetical protein
MCDAVAVAVAGTPYVVLDEDNRVVDVSPAARARFGPLLGKNVLDCFPDSRPLFHPQYERARRTGEVVEFAQYYDGYVVNLKVVPDGHRLTVYWETLCTLDVLTLDGLRASLQNAVQALAVTEETRRHDTVRRSLRVVGGDA